jgi:DNA invertase Pin-like site-specific DNA recombinase
MGHRHFYGTHDEEELYMRVSIYARCSTKDRGQDTENQLVQLRSFAATQGWTIWREYVDYESGSHDDRPQFQQMFQDASKRSFDVLLFWSLDRLSRQGVLETLQHLQRLTGYGIGYRSFTEQYLDSCGIFRDAVIGILAVIAKQERVRISERTRAGLASARAKGKTLGRPRVTVDTVEVRRLRDAGHSFRAISRQLGIAVGTIHSACGERGKVRST